MKHFTVQTILGAGLITLLCGCATKQAASTLAPVEVRAIDTSLSALKSQFNRDPSKPRLLAIFSPTCGGCIYGAKALQHEAKKVPLLAQDAELIVVWVFMLPSDNESEGRKAAQLFDFPGARHFYDGQNEIGRLLRAEQFPNAIRDALATLPAEHPMRKSLEERKNLPPEKMRVWDSVLIFPPGARWDEHTPKPDWSTVQTGSRIEEKPGHSKVVFWKNGVPVGSDWYLEAEEAVEVAQGKHSGGK